MEAKSKEPQYTLLSLDRRELPTSVVSRSDSVRNPDGEEAPVHNASGDEAQLHIRAAEDDVAMELYATGFNAWNQLFFEPLTPDEEPNDVFEFTKVLNGRNLGQVAAHLSYTCVKRKGEVCSAGRASDLEIYAYDNPRSRANAVRANGATIVLQADKTSSEHSLLWFPSLGAFRNDKDRIVYPFIRPITQIAAYDVGFVALQNDGTVYTFGDSRFSDCLGRETDDSSPPDKPGEVTDLSDLGDPVKKISAGGYTVAALTEGGALYVWGAQSTGSQGRHQAFPDISGIPNFIEVDGDKDVRDMAVGESHAIALTTDGCVYVIGGNTNGQLGLGMETGIVSSWTKVEFQATEGWEVVGVEAGPRSSFIITSQKGEAGHLNQNFC